jgi:Spy/CpxP family protein refolding chaperone
MVTRRAELHIRKVYTLAALVTACGALMFGQGQGKHFGWGNGNPMGGFGLGAPQLERLAEYLNLTDQQVADARAIFEAARLEEDKIQPDPKDLRDQITALVRKTTAEYDAGIQPLLAAHTAAEAQELAIKTRAMNRFWNLLTADQRIKAEEMEKFLKAPPVNQGSAGKENGNNGNGKGKGKNGN